MVHTAVTKSAQFLQLHNKESPGIYFVFQIKELDSIQVSELDESSSQTYYIITFNHFDKKLLQFRDQKLVNDSSSLLPSDILFEYLYEEPAKRKFQPRDTY